MCLCDVAAARAKRIEELRVRRDAAQLIKDVNVMLAAASKEEK